jgi:hypothetical protein
MLASRTTVPLIFGFFPTIALTYLIWKDEPQLMLVGNALFAVANSQVGFLGCKILGFGNIFGDFLDDFL